jgi:hypothetical protein
MNDTTRRFTDVIGYLVDGVVSGKAVENGDELELHHLKWRLKRGIALRTADCACEYEPNPEEDGAIGILKAISEYVEKEEEWNAMMDRDYPPSSEQPLDTTNLTLKEEDFSNVSE